MSTPSTPSTPPNAQSDLALMEHADGEVDGEASAGASGENEEAEILARIERDPDARAKVEAIQQIGELVRGHLELSADAVHDAKFAAMWRRIDGQIGGQRDAPPAGIWARITGWFDRHRGHVITGAVSAGAVAALALVLRPSAPDSGTLGRGRAAIDVRPVALRATPEIDSLDTPGGSSTVINLDDEDGHTTVIWVTPADTLEGI
jgi:hypothetical protein